MLLLFVLSCPLQLEASERFPMGFVPLGKTNTLVRRLFYREGMREQELAAEAALAVVRGMRARIDAYRVDFHEEKLWTREEDDHGKRLLQLCQKDLEVRDDEVSRGRLSIICNTQTPSFIYSL